VRDTLTTTTKLFGSSAPARTHHTTNEYRAVPNTSSLILSKTKVEPGSTDAGAETDTVYDYDRFGNVTTTLVCASDFEACALEAPDTMPFRRTSVSFKTSDLTVPVTYGDGRFPTMTTNAAGHTERAVYDPLLGLVSNSSGPNGIQTCYTYDPFGRKTSETARCGSTQQLTTTIQRFEAPPPPPCGADICPVPKIKTITLTQPPGASPSWTFSDAQGRDLEILTRGFDGGYVETLTEYDTFARVHRTSKPFRSSDSPLWATMTYDPLGRVNIATQDLGVVDGTALAATPATSTLTTTFLGTSISTTRTVNGQDLVRIEAKNVLGKVAKVTENGHAIGYTYDVDGNLRFVSDSPDSPSLAHVTELRYDSRGRKTFTDDPDLGIWTYGYNGYGELISQMDAVGNTVSVTYDKIGRVVTKDDGTAKAQWVYDVAPGAGVGKVAAMVSTPDPRLKAPCAIPLTTETGGNRAGRSFRYTEFGDLLESAECVDGDTFLTTYGYDDLGRQSTVTYPQVGPSRLSVGYHYTTLGYLHYLTDGAGGATYWAAKTMDSLGHVTDQYTGNGVETASNYASFTGWLLGSTGVSHGRADSLIQNWSYRYDEGGNLLRRVRADEVDTATSDETFTYDGLERVKTAHVVTSDGYDQTETYGYDALGLGNLTTKGAKTLAYDAGCFAGSRPAGPHAVCTVDGGSQFGYDANGNLTSGNGRTVSYNAFNKAMHIDATGAQAGGVDFVYGANGDRVVQEASTPGGTPVRTVYVGLGATGKSFYERTTTGNTTEHVQFIYAGGAHGGNAFAVRTLVADTGAVAATKYYGFDHLGSVTAMSDDEGRILAPALFGDADATVMTYDAWGARRSPGGRAATAPLHLQTGHREFTGHEAIPNIGLVNMNGRIYDPALGRFMTPDPNVQFIGNLQSYNRYSYVLNNPLRYTDPTGFFLGLSGQSWLKIGTSLATIAVCAASSGAGCVAAVLNFALLNMAVSVSEGAPLGQAALATGIGLAVGFATGGVVQGDALWVAMVNGAISGMTSTFVNAVVFQQSLGWNLLESMAEGAVSGAAGYGAQRALGVSQASAAAQRGGAAGARASRLAGGRDTGIVLADNYNGADGHSGNLVNDAGPIYDVDRPVRVATPDAIISEDPLMDAITTVAGGRAVIGAGRALVGGMAEEELVSVMHFTDQPPLFTQRVRCA
jgi:RHS repeat-associated protein